MLQLNHLDIRVHWTFAKPDVTSVLPKKLNVAQDFKSLITREESYKLTNVNTKMPLSLVKEILQKTVDNATVQGFDKEKFSYNLSDLQFYSESFYLVFLTETLI